MKKWLLNNNKYEALTDFRHVHYDGHIRHIKICVPFKDYDMLRLLSDDTSYTLKFNDNYYIGFFNIKEVVGVSGYNEGRIIRIDLNKLEIDKAPVSWVRQFKINSIFD